MLGLSRNIYVMSTVMSLNFASISMMVLVAGLLGASLAPTPELATLPVALMVVGTAITTIPAAFVMRRLGRKRGMAVGMLLALTGAGLALVATQTDNFYLFLIGACFIGANAAFTQQGRFIILENADTEHQKANGLTLALMANLAAAIAGPMLGAYGKDLLTGGPYAGSFLFLGLIILLSLICLSLYKEIEVAEATDYLTKRSLSELFKQPLFVLAVGSAAIGYAVMAFVMTATPISMHEVENHSLNHTTLVIQSHLVAMYLPSVLTGELLKRNFKFSLLFLGMGLYLVVGLVALAGQEVLHYWWALVLLGLGWNFLFVTSTALLPSTYSENEKHTAQAANDFSIFTAQALAAFLAGWVLFNFGWSNIVLVAVFASAFWLACIGVLVVKITGQKT